MQQTLNFDVCANRHKNNPQSVKANKRVNKTGDTITIIDFIAENGTGYLKQIARAMGKFPNQISGRFSSLKANGVIEPTGEEMEGCAVYRLVKKD